MKLEEFTQETDKLEKFYGKELDQYEKDIWFQELKYMSVKRYQQIIKKIFVENKFMPKLADIISMHRELPVDSNKQEIKKVKCEKCNGTGFILYKKLIEGYEYEYFARCNCVNGNRFVYDGRKVNDPKNKSDYYIPSVSEINL